MNSLGRLVNELALTLSIIVDYFYSSYMFMLSTNWWSNLNRVICFPGLVGKIYFSSSMNCFLLKISSHSRNILKTDFPDGVSVIQNTTSSTAGSSNPSQSALRCQNQQSCHFPQNYHTRFLSQFCIINSYSHHQCTLEIMYQISLGYKFEPWKKARRFDLNGFSTGEDISARYLLLAQRSTSSSPSGSPGCLTLCKETICREAFWGLELIQPKSSKYPAKNLAFKCKVLSR